MCVYYCSTYYKAVRGGGAGGGIDVYSISINSVALRSATCSWCERASRSGQLRASASALMVKMVFSLQVSEHAPRAPRIEVGGTRLQPGAFRDTHELEAAVVM